jgi:transcriptional regulator with XRE-family HTH domain
MTVMEGRRLSLGLSANQLAERVGITGVALRYIERRRTREPRAEIAAAIAAELELPADVLLWELAENENGAR